jgi:polar amino acid transport system substrate-binding protein
MKKQLIKFVTGFALSALLMAGTAGCSEASSGTSSASAAGSGAGTSAASASAATGTLLQSIKSKGTLVAGTASGYPPYEFIDTSKSDKEVVGIDMALAEKIADKLGVKLKIQDMSFSALLSSLASNNVDIAIAGISPTDERKKTVDFSDNYLDASQKILIRKEDADKLKTIADFKGKTIGAEKSTTQEKLAQTEMSGSTLVSLERVPDLIMELTNKKIEGIVIESTVAQQYLLSNQNIALSAASFKNGTKESAIALNKGNEDLVKIINEVIQENKSNGNFDKWIKQYSQLAVNNAK